MFNNPVVFLAIQFEYAPWLHSVKYLVMFIFLFNQICSRKWVGLPSYLFHRFQFNLWFSRFIHWKGYCSYLYQLLYLGDRLSTFWFLETISLLYRNPIMLGVFSEFFWVLSKSVFWIWFPMAYGRWLFVFLFHTHIREISELKIGLQEFL